MSNQQDTTMTLAEAIDLTKILSDLYINGIDTTNMTLAEAMEKWQQIVVQCQSEE